VSDHATFRYRGSVILLAASLTVIVVSGAVIWWTMAGSRPPDPVRQVIPQFTIDPDEDPAVTSSAPPSPSTPSPSPRQSPSEERGTASIPPVADTYVVAENPTTNYGSQTKLTASNWNNPWHSQAYLRFTVPQPPGGMVIASAELRLVYQKTSQQAALTEVRSVADTSWSETAMTYQNRPALGEIIATATLPQSGATVLRFDVSAAIRSPGSYCLAMTNPTPQSSTVVYSKEQGADGPRLVLIYRRAGSG
jgi:hypothetical protein